MSRHALTGLALSLLLALLPHPGLAQDEPIREPDIAPTTAPVVVDGERLFDVVGTQSFSASDRAQAISKRIRQVARDTTLSKSQVVYKDKGTYFEVLAGKKNLLGIYPTDASVVSLTNQEMAEIAILRIGEAVERYRRNRSSEYLFRASLRSLSAFIGGALIIALTLFLSNRLGRAIDSRYKTRVQDLKIESFEVLRADNIWNAVNGFRRLVRLVVLVIVCYLVLEFVLFQFPWTRGLAKTLLEGITGPLVTIGTAILDYLPKLMFLVILIVIVRYILKLTHLFFKAIEKGKVQIRGFESEWAQPTYKLLRFLVILLTIVLAYPYIPGSGSAAFQGLSILLGVMVSLGASSAISSIVAGYAMTYRRAFRIGDRIQVGEHIGVVDEMRLLVTHLRTFHNQEVILPNSQILSSSVVNLSRPAQDDGLMIHTEVGIGYETPWRQVEAMLKEAANLTRSVKTTPAPFVLIKSLGDYAVQYELNAYVAGASHLPHRYAELHRNILDKFNEYGVAIMTPSYMADPENAKLVPPEQWYAAPAKSAVEPQARTGDDQNRTVAEKKQI